MLQSMVLQKVRHDSVTEQQINFKKQDNLMWNKDLKISLKIFKNKLGVSITRISKLIFDIITGSLCTCAHSVMSHALRLHGV